MSQDKLRRVVLEVERKFSRLMVHPLKVDGGKPAFRSLLPLGTRSFRDVYYDHNALLASSGTWARRRDGSWQVKIRQAGDFNQSQFREIQDPDEIQSHLRKLMNKAALESENFGLSVLANITTRRQMWRADDKFAIVLDHTDFGHTVGEVELESVVTVRSLAQEREICASMDREVADFMRHYHWAFDTRSVVGKLTAYFDHKGISARMGL